MSQIFLRHECMWTLQVMLMSEVAEAIRLVITQFLLQNLKFGVVEGKIE